ncbi:helix-turn-helix domain-containing protein [Limosilactobacillus antri]|uniref:helix-turn-helix domain-containing protein n=1 Tax=Limosilactobacillus antri TaxID=227943 RepID=UPI001F58CCAA|nr:helix-turn-helix transcriptional regulator [Limosilactobacillus antri]
MNINHRIRKIRQELHMTQEQLADKADLSLNFISKLERSASQNLSLENASKIAKALNIRLADLIDDREKNSDVEQLNYLLSQLSNESQSELATSFSLIVKSILKHK